MQVRDAAAAGAAIAALLILVYTYTAAGGGGRFVAVENGTLVSSTLPYIEGPGWYRLYSFWAYHLVVVNPRPLIAGQGYYYFGPQHFYHYINPNYISLFLEGACSGFTLIDELWSFPRDSPWNYGVVPYDCTCAIGCGSIRYGAVSFYDTGCLTSHGDDVYVVVVDGSLYPWKFGEVKALPAVQEGPVGVYQYRYGYHGWSYICPCPLPHCMFMVNATRGVGQIVVRLMGSMWHVETPNGTYYVPYNSGRDIYVVVTPHRLWDMSLWPPHGYYNTPWGGVVNLSVVVLDGIPYYSLPKYSPGPVDNVVGGYWGNPPIATYVVELLTRPYEWDDVFLAPYVTQPLGPTPTRPYPSPPPVTFYPFTVYLPRGCRLYLPYPVSTDLGVSPPR